MFLEGIDKGSEGLVFKGVKLKIDGRRNASQNQMEEFETDRQAFIDALLSNITSRFPNVQLLSAFQVILLSNDSTVHQRYS